MGLARRCRLVGASFVTSWCRGCIVGATGRSSAPSAARRTGATARRICGRSWRIGGRPSPSWNGWSGSLRWGCPPWQTLSERALPQEHSGTRGGWSCASTGIGTSSSCSSSCSSSNSRRKLQQQHQANAGVRTIDFLSAKTVGAAELLNGDRRETKPIRTHAQLTTYYTSQ